MNKIHLFIAACSLAFVSVQTFANSTAQAVKDQSVEQQLYGVYALYNHPSEGSSQ